MEYFLCAFLTQTQTQIPFLICRYQIANILTALSESPEALARSDHSWIDCII